MAHACRRLAGKVRIRYPTVDRLLSKVKKYLLKHPPVSRNSKKSAVARRYPNFQFLPDGICGWKCASSAHSPTFPSLHLRHSSFSNPSVAFPTSQLILQPFRCFTYITVHSPTLPLLHLHHSSFSNPSLASPTSQNHHFRHLASRPSLPYYFYREFCINYNGFSDTLINITTPYPWKALPQIVSFKYVVLNEQMNMEYHNNEKI